MKSEYAAQYRDLYENHWWWRARESYILGILRRERAQKKHGAVLDIGCGDGLFFDHLAEFGEVEGVEADAAIVSDDGPHRDRIHVCQFDETFQPGKKYSLIVMLDLLEHLPDPLGGLKHALELLEEDGTIVITVPAFRALWTTHDDWNHNFTRYTKRTFLSSARDAEMQIDSMRYFFHWTCPIKLAIRVKEALFGSSPKPAQVPPAVVNFAMFALSRIEQATISKLPMPFGSSLVAVGRKQSSLSEIHSIKQEES